MTPRLRWCVPILAVILLLVLVPSTPAWAELRTDNEITYTVDPDAGVLRVEADLRITNMTPDAFVDGQTVRYFYTEIGIPIPNTALGVTVSSNGRPLDYTFTRGAPREGRHARVDFGRELHYRDSIDLTISYATPGDMPRTPSTFRVNPAYFSFPVIAWGDPGRVTINVVAPQEFALISDGSELGQGDIVDGNSVFTIRDIADVERFGIHLRGLNDDALVVTPLDFGDFRLAIGAWPGDVLWPERTAQAVERSLPELQRLIGLEWGPPDRLLITESLEVSLAGYGGWYLRDDNLVSIGEHVDPHLVLHELSHVWFNHTMFQERWIVEGLADEFSVSAVANTSQDADPGVRPVTAPEPIEHVSHLNEWVLPKDFEGLVSREDRVAYEDFGYTTSFWVIQAIAQEIGIDRLASVVHAAVDDEIAYVGSGAPETVAGVDDWRRFLDLLEEVGGSAIANDLFVEFVTDEDLLPRLEAREAYYSLAESGWAPPYYIRSAMSSWEFDTARSRITEAENLLAVRQRIDLGLEQLGIPGRDTLRTLYETATDSLVEAHRYAGDSLTAIETTVAARDSVAVDRGLVVTLGLWGTDLDDNYRAVHEALAAEQFDRVASEAAGLSQVLAEAETRGFQRLGMGAAVLIALVLLGFWLRSRRAIPDQDDSG